MARIVVETLYKHYAQQFEMVGSPIVEERSPFQDILIFDTHTHGRVMVLDGIVQITERDECAYSEMLSHLPILESGAVSKVMIVGGGDGAIAEEVLKHKSISQVDLVDIDGHVIEQCKKHFKAVHKGVFDDKRLHVYAEDAFKFLKDDATEGRYDLIIADRPDPVGPAAVLFADEFYKLVRRALTPHGVACFQNGVPLLQAEELTETAKQIAGVFEASGAFLTVVPTYIGGYMALTWASRGFRLGDGAKMQTVRDRFKASQIHTDYYTPDIHYAAFSLPPFVKRLIQ